MKIADIKVYKIYAVWRNFVVVEVTTDNGIKGYGEGTMGDFESTVEAAILDFKPHLLSKEVNPNWAYNFLTKNFFWRGGPILMTAVSAVEQALWDAKAKELQVPLYQMLGGEVSNRIKVYANGFISGDREVDEFVKAFKKVKELGFKAAKFDPFGGSGPTITDEELKRAEDRVSAVRDAVGDNFDILVDAHGRFNIASSIRVAEMLRKYNVFWLEEPVPEEDIDSLKVVRSKSIITIATGERLVTLNRFVELINSGAADVIQPDVCHVGGLGTLSKIASLASAKYLSVAPHNPNGPIATAHTLNAMLTMPNGLIMEFWLDAPSVRKDLLTEYFELRNGYIYPPKKPGIGFDVNEDALNKYPYRKLHLEYFSKDYRYFGDIKDEPPEK